jgi:tRNA pseudouridine55 synthase
MDGILNINKAPGMTSHDVVARVRKLLKQKRVGHAGTLDPAARGVLPICIGQATRLAEYISDSGKLYQAEITFGIVTDTYDNEGTVLRTGDVPALELAQLEAVLSSFLGPHMQLPPRYSAVKLRGQPAYKRTRAGEEVMLEPRPVEIQQLQVLDWQPPRLTLVVACSKGTYIRSLAYDIGERVGCGAYLSALLRTRSGPFAIADSVTLEQLSAAIEQGDASKYILPPDSALPHYPAIHLDPVTSVRVLHGNKFRYDQLQPVAQLARIYDATGRFLAIASWDAEQQMWQPNKVLVTP